MATLPKTVVAGIIVGLGVTAPCAAHDDAPLPVAKSIGFNKADGSAAYGVFLRWTDSPTTTTHAAVVDTHAGYDGARGGAAFETRAEAVIYGQAVQGRATPVGLAVFGGGAHAGATGMRADVNSGFGGLKLQALFQARHALDAAVAVAYQSRGFNLRPAVATDLLLGRRFGDTQLLLQLTYGHGLEDGERYGSLRAALLRRLVAELRGGIDAKISSDLEFDENEPENEPELQMMAGPVLSYTAWHLSFTIQGGVSAIRYRDTPDTRLGMVASLGVGATL